MCNIRLIAKRCACYNGGPVNCWHPKIPLLCQLYFTTYSINIPYLI